ncbi:hypothetical protein MetMK1DRAFT_00011890 [Metallosphaera yellowstonensis MK1]|uniref:Succinate dehydrogenase subunit D n=1 Tax=Metallosphaera yellowstonensis MK1 TaxID=671065 RepID=H2C365_9CREN|nr:hypothetical protein MetMK1DRAFT_00011890 [Metallosphaera yellowstonensis MK1]
MISLEKLRELGIEVKEWREVYERPGRDPFAKEAEYRVSDVFWGKFHLRNDGDLYVLVISKIPFNWKERLKDMKLKGEVVDAAGGVMWIKEEEEWLEQDFKTLRDYLEKVKGERK